ncbi:MAG: hypothetical protein C0622_06545 [Desulfuromonas sp.]|nr:MAG: hypothetical protein C0622_06545 [Desulfuromonas sp.]
MNLLFGYYPGLRDEFVKTGDIRRQESGFDCPDLEQKKKPLRKKLYQAAQDYLLPWQCLLIILSPYVCSVRKHSKNEKLQQAILEKQLLFV